jgi:hypothetical protein
METVSFPTSLGELEAAVRSGGETGRLAFELLSLTALGNEVARPVVKTLESDIKTGKVILEKPPKLVVKKESQLLPPDRD